MTKKQDDDTAKRILIAGGGTGGHVYPALATIEALKKRGDFKFLYVGGKNGIETRIVPSQNIPMKTIWIAGIARSLTLKNLLFPFKLLASLAASWKIVSRFRPDAAVGTGGYVSGPVLFITAKRGVPVLIQEQDVHPGLTTKLLAKHAKKICLAFPGAEKHFLGMSEKIVVTGNPVRNDLLGITPAEGRKIWQLDKDKLTIFVFGGSQGARSINEAMGKILPALLRKYDIQLLWQTGEKQYDAVIESLEIDEKRVRIVPYVKKMNAAYAAADLIICRAGAITLAELANVGKPAVLVPYPFAAGDHQVRNSQMIVEAGAAIMVEEKNGWGANLQMAIERLLTDPALREQQSTAWQKLARPTAADDIAAEIIKLIKN